MNLEQPALPFAGRTVHSRHASYTGAVEAQRTHRGKTRIYLDWLRAHGPATDKDARVALGFELGTINSVRNTLYNANCIGSCGEVPGCGKATRTLWRVLEGK